MSFEQFCDVIGKLSAIGFGTAQSAKKQQRNSEGEDQLLSDQMVTMLQYCQLSNHKKFRQKMKKLNIQYRAGPKTNAQMKVVPDGYRFKYAPTNGKS